MPWDTWMQIALGILRHSPKDFWSMSYREFNNAYEGLLIEKGAKEDENKYPTLDDFERLKNQCPSHQ